MTARRHPAAAVHGTGDHGDTTAAQLSAFAGALAVLALACCALALSYFVCPTWAGRLCADEHAKYLAPLLVPTTAYFAIANWVGWQYFRFA
ncbi:hypothetical protein Q5752_002866 [Cryptotrichosporon argae]